MLKLFTKLKTNTSGATAIEYGLIAALVAVAIIGVVGTVGDELVNTFTAVGDELGAANSGGASSEGDSGSN